MLLSRILGGLGRFFISLGVLTLLFVSYQLWGTGIMTAQAQNALEGDFEDLLAAADEPGPVEVIDEPADETAEPEPEAMGRAERRQLSRLLWQPDGEPVAQIFAPDIDLDWTVVAGVNSDDLSRGPGHYTGTPMPGQPGNASIAGHRTTWGAPFNRIDELRPGDEITMRTVQGTFVYRVIEQENGKGHFIVTPDRVDVLDQDFAESPNRLTLTACHPKFSAAQRIIVVAELVGEPAPFIGPPGDGQLGDVQLASEDVADDQSGGADPAGPAGDPAESAPEADPAAPTDDSSAMPDDAVAAVPVGGADPTAGLSDAGDTDDFGEGLNGDRAAILPSITWGLAALAIWATAVFVAARWRRVPSYVIGVVPFFAVLFMCFVHIDQAIPSY